MSALHKKSSYVPYQNNKLTMLLQSSLGTHGRSFVIVTGRTEGAHVVETLEALRFAETCSQVTLRSHRFAAASMAAALHTLDAQIEAVQQLIARKERWETRCVAHRAEPLWRLVSLVLSERAHRGCSSCPQCADSVPHTSTGGDALG